MSEANNVQSWRKEVSMDKNELFQMMQKSILDGNASEAQRLAELSLKEGVDPMESITIGFTPGIQKVGELWEEGEYFLPELVAGAEAMKAGMSVLSKELKGDMGQFTGKVVIGTVQGDIHDIGKTLVGAILSAHGFEVFDLGTDVPAESFVKTAREMDVHVVGLSALLTTTMTNQKNVIELFQKEGIRNKVKIIVGGAPVSKEWARRIGADDAPVDAFEAVLSVKKLLGQEVKA